MANTLNKSEIARFVFQEFLDMYKKRGYSDIQNELLKVSSITAKKYNDFHTAIDFLDRRYNHLQSNGSHKKAKSILFRTNYGIKFSSIILETKKHYLTKLIVSGKIDRLFALKNFIGYISDSDLHQFVYSYLTKMDEKYLCALITKIEEKLRDEKPDYIVFHGDNNPITRAIVFVCKKLKITTIDIQHGIYQTTALMDGRIADYVLVWGQYFRDMYLNQGVKKHEQIYILGYPYPIEKKVKKKHISGKRHVVYYLGQNFEKYNEELINIKLETIKALNDTCSKLGLKFIYRPHPGDDRNLLKSKRPEVKFVSDSEKLEDSFRKGDIFISFNSTSLIEAAMRSKICLQLMNYPLQSDNFENLGIVTKSFENIKDLEQYLVIISRSKKLGDFQTKFNNKYINIHPNPGNRFLEILGDLEKKKK